jgi:protein-S-isoprenylcysteine O-methyltransferase Ste14
MSNSRASGYPLFNVTENGVDRVVSLNFLMDPWVRWYLILNLWLILLFLLSFIPPLINAIILRLLIVLNLIIFFLSLFLILCWWRCMYDEIDLALMEAPRALVGTHLQWTCFLAQCTTPPHHLAHQDQLALLESH